MDRFRVLCVIALIAALTGCGTLPGGRHWGGDVTLKPGRGQVERAASAAARDPGTWMPALGAGLFLIGPIDRRVSDWAVEKQPLFGADASRETDRLRELTRTAVYGTALFTPSGPAPGRWLSNKARGMGIEGLAGLVTANVTGLLKRTIVRREPETADPGYESFTSAHATLPFNDAALVRRNTEHLDWPRGARRTVNAAALLSAAGSAWGRVEMGLHYPSDQLAGAAIGNFLGLFVHDLFMGLDTDQSLSVDIGAGSSYVGWQLRY